MAYPEYPEIGRLSCFSDFFVRFHIVCDRYTSDYAHFTFSDTIWPLLLSPNFGTQMITLTETASYQFFVLGTLLSVEYTRVSVVSHQLHKSYQVSSQSAEGYPSLIPPWAPASKIWPELYSVLLWKPLGWQLSDATDWTYEIPSTSFPSCHDIIFFGSNRTDKGRKCALPRLGNRYGLTFDNIHQRERGKTHYTTSIGRFVSGAD